MSLRQGFDGHVETAKHTGPLWPAWLSVIFVVVIVAGLVLELRFLAWLLAEALE